MMKSCANSPSELTLQPETLPWTGAPVRAVHDALGWFETKLGLERARYLPRSISLFVDLEIGDAAVCNFLESAADFLARELQARRARARRFVELGLFDEHWMDGFLTGRTALQPWAIYYSRECGLGIGDGIRFDTEADAGVIPCSTMRNHGVAWKRAAGRLDLWLATARKPGGDWDFDSDIGHESAHAAFAPIPLFSQALFEADRLPPLREVECAGEMAETHLALLIYFFMEIAVCAVRGESRDTPTRLPVAEPADLDALLRLSADLFPDDGFDAARGALARAHRRLDIESDHEIYELAAPILRVIPELSPLLGETRVPGGIF
jgi:hypothetical protein